MRQTKKIASYIIIPILVLSQFYPVIDVYARGLNNTTNKKPVSFTDINSLPSFPEDANRQPVDWSKVDWDQEIVLPADQEEYYKKMSESDSSEKMADVGRVELSKIRLGSDRALQYYHVPTEIQGLVRKYNADTEKLIGEQKTTRKAVLNLEVANVLVKNGFIAQNNETKLEMSGSNKLDLRTVQPLRVKSAKSYQEEDNSKTALTLKEVRKVEKGEKNIKTIGIEELSKRKMNSLPSVSKKDKVSMWQTIKQVSLNWGEKFKELFSVATAQADNITPVISYYDGIEKNTMDNLLYYVSQQQNLDGSFGTMNQYENTANIALLLSQFNRTDSGQYSLMIDYLKNTVPKNNREKAIKARLMVGLGQPYQALLDELLAQQSADNGGIGLDENYASDPETSMETALALWSANYSIGDKMPKFLAYVVNQIQSDGTMKYDTDGLPSYYLINKTAEYLKPFQNLSVGNGIGNVTIQSKIDSLLLFLSSHYDESTGVLMGSNDVIDKLMTVRIFKLYAVETVKTTALMNELTTAQNYNGNFDSNFESSIPALKIFALSDLVITNISTADTLVNQTSFTFSVTIKNIGYAPMSSARLYQFIDGFKYGDGYDLNIVGIQLDPMDQAIMNLSFSDTSRFVGDTEFKFYVESSNDANAKNNWNQQVLTFAPAINGTPGMPIYYAAQKFVSNGSPALYIHWSIKTDPNRLNYIVGYRETGTSAWSFFGINNTWDGATLSGPFEEGKTYDITAGVLNNNQQNVTYFNDYTVIKMSADGSKYVGGVAGTATIDNLPATDLDLWGYGVSAKVASDASFSYSPLGNGSAATFIDNAVYDRIWTKYPVNISATTTNVRLFTRLTPDAIAPTNDYFEIQYNSTFKVKNQTDVRVITMGADNLRIKEGDFYYFDSATNNWIFIGTYPSQNYTQIWFDWHIPSNLFGVDYKIKSILKDFSGNESLPREWGPFEVIDGTTPSGVLTVNTITDNQWVLGDKKNISWNITATNPISSISNLKLHFGNSFTGITSNINLASTSLDYVLPIQANYITDNAYVTLDVCDTNYNCGTLQTDSFSIVDKTASPNYPWGNPAIFSSFTNSNNTYNISRLLVNVFNNSDGTIDLIYKENEGQSWTDFGEHRRLFYRQFSNGEWGTPLLLEESVYISNNPSYPGINLNDFAIVQTASGEIHIGYSTYQDTGASGLDLADIYYLHVKNNQIVSRQRLSNDDTFSGRLSLAVGGNGRVHVAWIQGHKYSDNTGTNVLHYTNGDGLNSWLPETVIYNNYAAPQIIIDQNEPTILLADDYQFSLIRKSGNTWSVPVPIRRPDVLKSKLNIYTADLDKLSYIVQSLDTNNYEWLPSIKNRSDLEAILSQYNFVNKNSILRVWDTNGYSYNSSRFNLFKSGTSTYGIFYDKSNPDNNYHDEIWNVRVNVDFINSSSTVVKAKTIIDKLSTENQRFLNIASSDNSGYHLSYIEEVRNSQGQTTSIVHYAFYDGNNIYFDSRVSSLSMYANEPNIIKVNENKVWLYFNTRYSGMDQIFMNTADLSPIIDAKLNSVSPLYGANVKNASPNVSWSYSGPAIDSYSVLFGKDKNNLVEVGNGLSSTKFKLQNLENNTQYFWQVVGHGAGFKVYSNTWMFNTIIDNNKPTITNFNVGEVVVSSTNYLPITALATDQSTNIASAVYYFIDNASIKTAELPLVATDGSYNSSTENISGNIDLSGLIEGKSPYNLFIKAKDESDNWSDATSTIIKMVDQTDNDDALTGFGGGQKNDVEWNNNKLQLTATGKNSGVGFFTSRVIDSGKTNKWSSLSFVSAEPYGKQLPDNTQKETAYTTGNADMTGNILLYHFENEAVDSSGSNNNGTWQNGALSTSGGAYGKAGSFANGSYINAGTSTSLAIAKNITLEAWVNPVDSGAFKNILARDGGYYLALSNLKPAIYLVGTSPANWIGSATAIPLNTWSHIVATYDGSSAKIYINGVLSRSSAVSGNINTDSGKELWIGNRKENLANYRYKGMLDEVAVYNRVLSGDEVLGHYTRNQAQVNFQVRSCQTIDCNNSLFLGPDGTANTYYSLNDGVGSEVSMINLPDLQNSRYFQYNLKMTTKSSAVTPGLSSVSIGPGHIFLDVIVTPPTIVPVDQTDDDNTTNGFGGGAMNNVVWNIGQNALELTANGKTLGNGTFESRMIDAGISTAWQGIDWKTVSPVYKQLPDNTQKETAYTTGNADMTGNVLLYHFENEAVDSSGSNNNGSWQGGASSTNGGIYDKAGNFANGSYVNAGTSTSLAIAKNITLEAWVNPADSGAFKNILARDGGYYLALSSLKPVIYLVGTSPATWVGSTTAIPLNTWSHIVATYDGSSVKIYINGVLSRTAVATGNINTDSGKELWIGNRKENLTNYRYKGMLDEVAIYSRVLNSDEILAHYKRLKTNLDLLVRVCEDVLCVGTDYSKFDSARTGRYIQYKAIFTTTNSNLSPELSSVIFTPPHNLP